MGKGEIIISIVFISVVALVIGIIVSQDNKTKKEKSFSEQLSLLQTVKK